MWAFALRLWSAGIAEMGKVRGIFPLKSLLLGMAIKCSPVQGLWKAVVLGMWVDSLL